MENFSILRIELSIATIEIQFLFRFVETLENEKKKNLSIYNSNDLSILYKFELISDRIQ